MTYIPDGRTDENYNQKYLKEDDHEFLRGFDWCVEMATDMFFDNFFDELGDDHLVHVLREETPDCLQYEYEFPFTFAKPHAETRKVKTYADLLRSRMLSWIEDQRDMLITSMIDGYDEEEFKKIKAEVDGRSKKTNG